MFDAIQAETIGFPGHAGDLVEGYLARPLRPGPLGSVVVIHHLPGYDAATKEITRRLAVMGYQALCPNLYSREAPGASPDDAAAAVRAAGGLADDQVVGDVGAAAAHLRAMPASNGRVGVIGFCSGGRQSFLAGCRLDLDAVVDCYGAFVVGDPPAGSGLRMTPVLDQAWGLTAPVLGLFGADDAHPSPDETAVIAAELDRLAKPHEFHTFDGAGHGFFAVDRPSYRPQAATEGWQLVSRFYAEHLGADGP